MWEALREAVDEEMEADPRVCMMGELMSQVCASYVTVQNKYLIPSIHARTPVLAPKDTGTDDVCSFCRTWAVCR